MNDDEEAGVMASSIRNNYDDSILVEHLYACSEYCRMVPPNDVSNVAEWLSAVQKGGVIAMEVSHASVSFRAAPVKDNY